MFQRGFFLLVVRDDALADTLTQPVQRYTVARRVSSIREALPLLSSCDRWAGVILDIDALANPAESLSALRAAHALVPLLGVCSTPTAELINLVHTHRVELVCKPAGEENLTSFVQRALVNGWLPDERVAAWVDELSRRQGLTAREVQLMAYALGNEPRSQVMRRLGITENTLKTQVRALLRKCRARSMDELAKNVLREALLFDAPHSDDGFRNHDSGEFQVQSA